MLKALAAAARHSEVIRGLLLIGMVFGIVAALLSNRQPPTLEATATIAPVAPVLADLPPPTRTWEFFAGNHMCGLGIDAQAEGTWNTLHYVEVAISSGDDGGTRLLLDQPQRIVVSLHTIVDHGPPSGSTSLTVDGNAALVADFQQDEKAKTLAISPELSDTAFRALVQAFSYGHSLTVTFADDRTYRVDFNKDDFEEKLMRWAACRTGHG